MLSLMMYTCIPGEFGDIYCGKYYSQRREFVDVAVKSLKECESEKEKRNFEREMAISADPKMKHPNIVRVYGLVRRGNFSIATWDIVYIYMQLDSTFHILQCCVAIDLQLKFSAIISENWIVMEYLPFGDLKTFLTVIANS